MFDDFYGFTGRPFQLTPDPAFYFESLSHRKALSYLGYGLAQGEGFIVITGEVGAGKSTLVAHLMNTVDSARLTATQIVTSKLDGAEIVHVVARAFGIRTPGHDKASALSAIELFLHEEARHGRRALLVVDEAQNLAIEALEELRMLSNFQLGAQPLLQILLLGQPEFRQTIQLHPSLEQLRQRVIAAHHLDALESREVEPYVRHRLACVGWNGDPEFDERVFAELYTASGGVPRRINQIANRLLLLGAVDRSHRLDGAMLSQVLAELTGDGAFALGSPADALVLPGLRGEAPAPAPAPAPTPTILPAAVSAPVETPPVLAAAAAAPATLPEALGGELAKRDEQIAELQQAVLELAETAEGSGLLQPEAHRIDIEALHQRIAALEARVIEQENTIRHTLTMLIEWVEAGTDRAAA
ncbi:MAG: XrtA-associated ATPase [Sphingomonadales bacterium]|nr:XrtA-associated ATPase [Sphingomonadales bacterium]